MAQQEQELRTLCEQLSTLPPQASLAQPLVLHAGVRNRQLLTKLTLAMQPYRHAVMRLKKRLGHAVHRQLAHAAQLPSASHATASPRIYCTNGGVLWPAAFEQLSSIPEADVREGLRILGEELMESTVMHLAAAKHFLPLRLAAMTLPNVRSLITLHLPVAAISNNVQTILIDAHELLLPEQDIFVALSAALGLLSSCTLSPTLPTPNTASASATNTSTLTTSSDTASFITTSAAASSSSTLSSGSTSPSSGSAAPVKSAVTSFKKQWATAGRPPHYHRFPRLVPTAIEFMSGCGVGAADRRRTDIVTVTGTSCDELRTYLLEHVPGLKEYGISDRTIAHLMVPPRKNALSAARYFAVINGRVPHKRNNRSEYQEDSHYCHAVVKLALELHALFAHESAMFSSDDMNTMRCGTQAVSRRFHINRYYLFGNEPNYLDHDFPTNRYHIKCSGIMRLMPTAATRQSALSGSASPVCRARANSVDLNLLRAEIMDAADTDGTVDDQNLVLDGWMDG